MLSRVQARHQRELHDGDVGVRVGLLERGERSVVEAALGVGRRLEPGAAAEVADVRRQLGVAGLGSSNWSAGC
jgi:hypothetical protein